MLLYNATVQKKKEHKANNALCNMLTVSIGNKSAVLRSYYF